MSKSVNSDAWPRRTAGPSSRSSSTGCSPPASSRCPPPPRLPREGVYAPVALSAVNCLAVETPCTPCVWVCRALDSAFRHCPARAGVTWFSQSSGGAGFRTTVRALSGRSSGLSVLRSKSNFCGAFVWARRALNGQQRRVPAGQSPTATRWTSRATRRCSLPPSSAPGLQTQGGHGGSHAPRGPAIR